jgi:succinate dehydrogenase/fumarate reductase flavoprotein subunit
MAAATAARLGLRVVVVEAAAKLGGTTSLSGGNLWVPDSSLMQAAGIEDSRPSALRYLEAVTRGEVPRSALEAYLAAGPAMVAFAARELEVRFHVIPELPDYRPDLPGAHPGGRTIEADPIPAAAAGVWADRVHVGPTFVPMTYQEVIRWRAYAYPHHVNGTVVAERRRDAIRTLGLALTTALVRACLAGGVTLLASTRVTTLQRGTAGRVAGVLAERDGRTVRLSARRGVVLACGGYEWHDGMVRAFLRGPLRGPASLSHNRGANVELATQVGARLDCLSEAWWYPTVHLPGEAFEGTPYYRMFRERSLPGCVMVNLAGRRFVDEAQSYNDLVHAMHEFDAGTYGWRNLPAFLLLDARFRRTYAFQSLAPGDPAPAWLPGYPSWDALAQAHGIDAAGLRQGMEAYNRAAASGEDPAFGRGARTFGPYAGDPAHHPNPCLAPLVEPPFFAMEVHPGALGTKGGPAVDEVARVLDWSGRPIEGLYACGNAAASVMGPGYPGAGATLGPALAFGYIAARHLAGAGRPVPDRRRRPASDR